MMIGIFIVISLASILAIVVIWMLSIVRNNQAESGQETSEEVPDVTLPLSIEPSSTLVSPDQRKEPSPDPLFDGTFMLVSPQTYYPTIDEVPEETMETLKSITSVMPRLPGVAIDLLPVLSKPGAGAKEVADIVQRDQVAAARLLRWVNSSFYGLEGKVDSLHRAVCILGLDTVRTTVLEESFQRSISVNYISGLAASTVWRHAAAVSICSRHLAIPARGINPGVAATAGLLHDVGLLPMLFLERKKLQEAMDISRVENAPLIACEDRAIGFNHQVLGEIFTRSWNLPEYIATAVGSHHSPMKEPIEPLAIVLWLADYLAARLGFACPAGQMPHCDEAELGELASKIGLRPSLSMYMTEGLMRELVKATNCWPAETDAVEAVVTLSR
jgi:HD-like signal output (HDOD) protein